MREKFNDLLKNAPEQTQNEETIYRRSDCPRLIPMQ